MTEFDENKATAMMDLYSRQIGAYGVETMKNLVSLDVLIVGMKGVGVETAKNLILAGPRSVTIADPNPTECIDLSSNFFLKEADVGKPRAELCKKPLSVLNPYVSVNVLNKTCNNISPEDISKFGAVVVCDNSVPLSLLKEWNVTCRSKNILFLIGMANGVTANVFADFGPEHIVTDDTGETSLVSIIEDITIKKNPETGTSEVIATLTESHGFDDDQLVIVSDVEGMEQLNNTGKITVSRIYTPYDNGRRKRLAPTKLKLNVNPALIEKLTPYKCGGLVTEVKLPQRLTFRCLEEALVNPKYDMFIIHPNTEKMFQGRAEQLHFALLALWEFQEKNRCLPKLHSMTAAKECVEIAKKRLEEHKKLPPESTVTVETIQEEVIINSCLYCHAELSGLATFVGGILAQEVVKKFGKFTPLRQWLHLDFFEMLQNQVPEDAAPVGSRYDSQITIFGKAFQEKLEKQKWFMVGCGALGCEYLKGFALMGLGANGGVLHVTDMDRIEVSNLNRQFLFRKDNVGQQKSVCAANAAKEMNPKMNITCFETKVAPETENIFHDDFWENLDGVCNALDNIAARRYVDGRCVLFEKPLLESGTLGTKANSEIIIPHSTMTYSEGAEPEQGKAIPMCTLRNFPHLIDHCIEWARAQFSELFEDTVKDVKKLLENREEFFNTLEKEKSASVQLEKITIVKNLLQYLHQPSFEKCIQLAVDQFVKQYRDRIRDLTYSFPVDAKKKDEDTGEETFFWSGTKRFPQYAELDPNNPLHKEYIFCTANLFAFLFRIPQVPSMEKFTPIFENCFSKIKIDPWEPPKKAVEDPTNENKEASQDPTPEDSSVVAQYKEELMKTDLSKLVVPQPAEFEKDDDTNFHIDFITACANMRAWNYHIKLASRHQCKMIAGHIIPAIATTTAMITGIVCLELYKLIQKLPKAQMCSSNVNLAVNTYSLFEPPPPIPAAASYDIIEMCDVKPVPNGFTVWDKIIVDRGDITVKQLVEILPEIHYGCKPEFLIKAHITKEDIASGLDKPLYSSFNPTKYLEELVQKNMSRSVREVCVELYNMNPSKKFILLEGSFQKEDDPVKVPPVKLIFGH